MGVMMNEVGRVIGKTPVEPIEYTVVFDKMGRAWQRFGIYWSCTHPNVANKMWITLLETYGPVTVVRWGNETS
jgi:hypothetical protein